jgi:hypothetical protein
MVSICHFSEVILVEARLLVSLRGRMYVEIVEALLFKGVCMLMRFAVIPSQAEDGVQCRQPVSRMTEKSRKFSVERLKATTNSFPDCVVILNSRRS